MLWKYLLLNVSKSGAKQWRDNEKAFRNRAREVMPEMPVLKYKKTWFDETCLEYLRDPEVCLNHKLHISLSNYNTSYGINRSIPVFEEFLDGWFENHITPLFSKIEIAGSEKNIPRAFELVTLIDGQKEQAFVRENPYEGSNVFIDPTTYCPSASYYLGNLNRLQ